MNMGLLLRNVGRCIILLLLQVLVLDNVYLGGYINPIIYVLFILMLPTGMNKIGMLMLAFCSGLVVDIFNNMLGFHAFACTLVAFLRVVYADRILTKDDPKVISMPSVFTVGAQEYIGFLALMLGLYNLIYFSLVVFDMHDWWRVLLLTLLSTIVSMLLCLLYQAVFVQEREKVSYKK